MGQMNKKWHKMSKDWDLGGPFGGQCDILFPKKYNRNTYMHFFTEWDTKEIHHRRIFMTMQKCSECIYIALSLKYMYIHQRPTEWNNLHNSHFTPPPPPPLSIFVFIYVFGVAYKTFLSTLFLKECDHISPQECILKALLCPFYAVGC